MNEAVRLTIAAILTFLTVLVACVILDEWIRHD